MKIAMKVILVMAFFAGFGLIAADKPFIQTKSKKIIADTISADAKGTLSYKASGFGQKIKPGAYLYARVPKPTAVSKAYKKIKSKKYGDAVKAFDKAYNKYRYIGWDVYCIYYSAYALNKLGKKAEAIAKINKLTALPKDRAKLSKYMDAQKLLAELYIATSQFEKAQGALKVLGTARSPSIAAFANNKQGDILAKKGKNKDALLMYLRTVLLFNKSNKKERPEALKKTIKILKSDRDNKYLIFEKMLKTDYPGK